MKKVLSILYVPLVFIKKEDLNLLKRFKKNVENIIKN